MGGVEWRVVVLFWGVFGCAIFLRCPFGGAVGGCGGKWYALVAVGSE